MKEKILKEVFIKMKGKTLKERGITLIALVITIIVLLILAGVTLSIVLHTGIIDNSQKAVDTYQAKAQNETETMDYLQDKFGLYISYLDNINGTENQKIIDANFTYYNPVVPVGFKAVNTEDASWKVVEDKNLGKVVQGWNDGLVIEDKDGNQFVWVPVDKENVKYEKWYGEKNNEQITGLNALSKTATGTEDNKDELPDGITDETSQITKYGGFYIGRYEAGTTLEWMERNTVATPIIKNGQKPWNYINYENAKLSAESMYSKENEKTGVYVQSGLLTGTMWDTVLKWIENSGVNVETDSSEWGNYYDAEVPEVEGYWNVGSEVEWGKFSLTDETWSSQENKTKPYNVYCMLRTGESEYTKIKNIYDLAGNVWEFTSELANDNSGVVTRGAYCASDKTKYAAASRGFELKDVEKYYETFRCALYISSLEN